MTRAVAEYLRAIHERRVTEREILKLDDNMLKDIGLSRDDLALGYELLSTIRQEQMDKVSGRRGEHRSENR